MNKYSELYKNTLNNKLAFSLVPAGSPALSSAIKPVAGRVIEAARPALTQGARSITSAAKPIMSKAVGVLGGIGATGAAAYQALGDGTALGKARDFGYEAFGKESPTTVARNQIMDMEQKRLNQRMSQIKGGLPVSGASARDGSLLKSMPQGPVAVLGSGSGNSVVAGAQKQLDTQLNQNTLASSGKGPGFVAPGPKMDTKMQTTNGMVETRPAIPVQAANAQGPDDAFLKKVMGSYNSSSALDNRKADAIRKAYKPGMSAKEIYADKGYIAASRR